MFWSYCISTVSLGTAYPFIPPKTIAYCDLIFSDNFGFIFS